MPAPREDERLIPEPRPPAPMAEDGARVLVVIDQDVAHDRRVRATLDAYRRQGFSVDVIDIRRAGHGAEREGAFARVRRLARCARFVVIDGLPAAARNLASLLRVVRKERALSYQLYAGWRHLGPALKDTVRIYHRGLRWFSAPRPPYALVHANDLRCLIFAAAARSRGDPMVLYDSHEANLFRNRVKSSVLRLAINFLFEGAAIRSAAQVVVVSAPIGGLLRSLYGHPRIDVVPNALYHDAVPVPLHRIAGAGAPEHRLAVVFFGGVNTGRGLRHLDRLGRECTSLDVHLVLFGEANEARKGLESLLGPARDRRLEVRCAGSEAIALDPALACRPLFSWCVIEDICLSYRLALPNKLFQSLAMRIPVITLAGTHVDAYAREHGIGVSLSPDEITSPARILTRLTAALAGYPAMQVRMEGLHASLARDPPGERLAQLAGRAMTERSSASPATFEGGGSGDLPSVRSGMRA